MTDTNDEQKQQQRAVLLGILGATAIGWGLYFLVLRALLPAPPTSQMALVWILLAPAGLIFVLVGAVGNGRFLSQGIDPLQGKDPRFIDVSNRALRNTVEQSMIFVLAGAALVHILPAEELAAVPALTVLFVLARIAFWLGYLATSMLRAPGMAITLQVNAVLLVWCILGLRG